MKNKLILFLVLITGIGTQSAQGAAPRSLVFLDENSAAETTASSAEKQTALYEPGYEIINKIEYGWLYTMVEQLSVQAGIKMPVLLFAPEDRGGIRIVTRTDHRLDLSSVDMTRNALTVLNRAELRATVAHEIVHIKNRDNVAKKTIDRIGAIGYWISLSGVAMHTILGSCKTKNVSANIIKYSLITAAVLGAYSIVQKGVSNYFSRSREYAADKGSVDICKDPLALADGLECIYNFNGHGKKLSESTISLQARYNNLFESHPPIHRRIVCLEAMAAKMEAAKDKEELS